MWEFLNAHSSPGHKHSDQQLYRGVHRVYLSTVQRGCTGYIDCTEGVHRVYRLYRGVHRVYRRYRGVHKGLFHCTRVCFGSIDLKGELYGFMEYKRVSTGGVLRVFQPYRGGGAYWVYQLHRKAPQQVSNIMFSFAIIIMFLFTLRGSIWGLKQTGKRGGEVMLYLWSVHCCECVCLGWGVLFYCGCNIYVAIIICG